MGYYNSFIVRIWSDERGRLRGRIEHVASQQHLVFSDPEKVIEFIRSHLVAPLTPSDADEEGLDELGGLEP